VQAGLRARGARLGGLRAGLGAGGTHLGLGGSSAAWLMYFLAKSCFWRSYSRVATSSCARAACTWASTAAALWSALRASMRSSNWPACTVSPALTASSTTAPGTCAATTVWRSASTTPS
jgi:hypothetical protein